jgi:hypothetical protein
MPGLEWPERRTNGCLRGRVLLARDHGGPSAGRARPSRADASRLWTTRQPHPSHRLHPGTFRRPGPVPVRGPIGCGGPHSEYAGRGPIRPHCGSRSVRAGGELRVVTRSTPTTSRASPTPRGTRPDSTAQRHPTTLSPLKASTTSPTSCTPQGDLDGARTCTRAPFRSARPPGTRLPRHCEKSRESCGGGGGAGESRVAV